MAGKGGAPRAPSFREVNLDFWLEGGGKGGGREGGDEGGGWEGGEEVGEGGGG